MLSGCFSGRPSPLLPPVHKNAHFGVDSIIFNSINILITVALVGKRLRVIKPNLRKLYSLRSPTNRNSGGSTFRFDMKINIRKGKYIINDPSKK